MKRTQWYCIDRGTGAETKVTAAYVVSKVCRHYSKTPAEALKIVNAAADNVSGVETSFFWYEPRVEEVSEQQSVAI